MLNMTNEFDYLVTHSGIFHADDVFSTAFMMILNPNAKVYRTLKPDDFVEEIKKNEPNAKCCIYDIGRGKFDHHQNDTPIRDNGIKYAAFGLLWKEFGDWEQYPYLDEEFIQSLDDHDNGGKTSELSCIIKLFNKNKYDSDLPDDMPYFNDIVENNMFLEAVDIAKKILYRKLYSYDEENDIKDILKEQEIKVNSLKLKWIYSPIAPKNNRYLYEEDIRLIVYPSDRGGINVQFRSDEYGSMKASYKFPDMWCGAEFKDLPEGVTFVHKSGFLANCKDMDSAMKMVDYYKIYLD